MAGICCFLILGHFALLVICFLISCMVWHYFLVHTLWKPPTSYSLKSNAQAFADSRFLPFRWYAVFYPSMCFISCAHCQLTSLPPKIWFSFLFSPTRTEILEKAMALHSSTFAWRIPWTEEPGRLPSMGLHRVGHNWSDLASKQGLHHMCTFAEQKWPRLRDIQLRIRSCLSRGLYLMGEIGF